MESEIAGRLSAVFRFVHVIAAIMWIGNSIPFIGMELNPIDPPPSKPDSDGKTPLNPPHGHLAMLHCGGVFHLEIRLIDPNSIPVTQPTSRSSPARRTTAPSSRCSSSRSLL